MAGITNAAYRRLLRRAGRRPLRLRDDHRRGLVERDETTLKMLVFDDLERIRSVQLYGTDPVYVGKAAEILCAEYGVAHIDLNFGCPVPKVTRKGGGGALPWKRGLLGEILTAAVGAATPYGVPVTMKTRKGIDDGPPDLPRRRAGSPRTPAAPRSPSTAGPSPSPTPARPTGTPSPGWSTTSSIPVLGNGDIWEAGDAVRMVEQTGAAGVVVGRGCLGRPWLFRDLAAAFAPGRPVGARPARPSARCGR